MAEQPNKPGSNGDSDTPRKIDDEQVVTNQSVVTPDAYPEPAGGDQMGDVDPKRKP